jgi:hypothetical protein
MQQEVHNSGVQLANKIKDSLEWTVVKGGSFIINHYRVEVMEVRVVNRTMGPDGIQWVDDPGGDYFLMDFLISRPKDADGGSTVLMYKPTATAKVSEVFGTGVNRKAIVDHLTRQLADAVHAHFLPIYNGDAI